MATAEVKQIEEALDVLLKACLDVEKIDRRIRPSNDPSGFDRVDFTKTSTKAEAAADHILVRPLGASYRLAIRVLGERLYEIGGDKLMSDVWERIAYRGSDDRKHPLRADILDKRWNGIGSWLS